MYTLCDGGCVVGFELDSDMMCTPAVPERRQHFLLQIRGCYRWLTIFLHRACVWDVWDSAKLARGEEDTERKMEVELGRIGVGKWSGYGGGQ